MGDHSCGIGIMNLFTKHYQGWVLMLPPILFLPIIGDGSDKADLCMYLMLIMIVYWIAEFLPLGVTSIIPLVLYPVMGILPTDTACQLYFKDTIVMFITSIMVASAIEYCNLHVRVALRVLQLVGCSPRRLHAGIIAVTCFLSMWISNAACTAMMTPIIYAVIDQLGNQNLIKQYKDEDANLPKNERRPSRLSACYYMTVAFASSVGGIGSLIGTPTNLTLKAIYDGRFPNSTDAIEFGVLMVYCVPVMIVLAIFLFLTMEFFFMGLFRPDSEAAKECEISDEGLKIGGQVITDKYNALGPISTSEITIAILFVCLIILYVFKTPGFMKGWADLFKSKQIKNSVPTVLVLILLFSLPANYKFLKFWDQEGMGPTPSLVSWQFLCNKVPWGLIFLVGGGAALAEGSKVSGMAVKLGKNLSSLDVLPPPILLLVFVATSVFSTNFSANTAIGNILLPVICEMAVEMRIHPLYFLYPVGLGCSFAFMLPVGTPANAIVQVYANIETKTMITGGFLPSITTIFILWAAAQTWGFVVYPSLDSFPSWAENSENDTKSILIDDWFD